MSLTDVTQPARSALVKQELDNDERTKSKEYIRLVVRAMNRLEETVTLALNWLINSDMRRANGGYKSEYDPQTRSFGSWGGGETSILSTAAASSALLTAKEYEDLAFDSGDNILSIQACRSDGSILAGEGSPFIYTRYIGEAIHTLLDLFRRSKKNKYLDAAIRSGKWIIENMQKPDGSLCDGLFIAKGGELKLRSASTWQAENVVVFERLFQETGMELFANAKAELVRWVSSVQRRDGSFFPLRRTGFSRGGIWDLRWALQSLDIVPWIIGWDTRKHPSSHTAALRAFLHAKDTTRALKVCSWLEHRLGPNGLFYEYYYGNSGHSTQEDVAPSAQFGTTLLQYPFLQDDRNLVQSICDGVFYAQVRSPDQNGNGGIKGTPGHVVNGNKVYTFDTSYAVLFMQNVIAGFSQEHQLYM